MIIHRAFIRETLHTGGLVSLVLLAIFLPLRLLGFLRQAAEGDIPLGGVLLLLALKTITYLDILVPLGLYAGVLLALARWIRDNELTVINASGVGMAQFLKPAFALFALVGALTALFSLYLSPLAAEASRAVTHELRQRADLLGVVPGVFTETRNRNSVYFIERYDRQSGEFRNIFIYDRGGNSVDGSEDRVVVAANGRKVTDKNGGDDFLLLQNGARYRATAGADEYAVLDFDAYRLRLTERPRTDYSLPLKALPTRELLRENHAAAIGELHWRLAKVVMPAVLLIFALAFSALTYRKSRIGSLLPALLVYFAYSNLLGVGVAMIRRGVADPHLTLWLIHLLFLALALYWLRRRHFNRPLLLPQRLA